jgi:hypothetical protein
MTDMGDTAMFSGGIALWFMLFGLCSVASGRAQGVPMGKVDTDCNDSIKNCKKPVKFISDQGGCYVFACEYGKPGAHTIRAKETNSVQALIALSRESGGGSLQMQPMAEAQAQASGNQTTAAAESQDTIVGCIGGSGGAYTITDPAGKTYQLTGKTADLVDHIGRQVSISGSRESQPSGASSGPSVASFDVKTVRTLSGTCSSK